MKRGKISIEPGKPLEFSATEEDTDSVLSDDARQISNAIRAYIQSAAALLKDRYRALIDAIPPFLKDPGDIFIVICSDGIVVRYDSKTRDSRLLRIAKSENNLAETALNLSERVLRLDVTPQEIPIGDCPRLSFAVITQAGPANEVLSIPIVVFATSKLPDEFVQGKPPARPVPIISMQSDIDLAMEGHVEPSDNFGSEPSDRQQFLAHSRFRLPVGWLAIEVYPPLGIEYWNASFAPMWAELDILASAAQRNLQQSQLNALDSRGATREMYSVLLDQFQELLAGPEEPVHQFLKSHPELISPTSDKVWSKLRFGDRVSDFVFREPHNDYELVELEAPIRPMFRKDGQQREELTHAINQISDWIQYIEDNKERVENELGLSGISSHPRSLVVIGRSEGLTEGDRRKLTTIQNQIPKLRIMTYDDLLAGARATLERILGPLSLKGQNVSIYFFNPTSKSGPE